MESILKVEHLEKYYGNRGNVTKAVDDISFTVTQGEYIGIMGASGSGKTTLLNCISTIDSATAGHIFIRGQDVTQLKAKELSRFRREQLGFIFQEFNLLDTLTAFENIALSALPLRRLTAVCTTSQNGLKLIVSWGNIPTSSPEASSSALRAHGR